MVLPIVMMTLAGESVTSELFDVILTVKFSEFSAVMLSINVEMLTQFRVTVELKTTTSSTAM